MIDIENGRLLPEPVKPDIIPTSADSPATLTTRMLERKGQACLLAVWAFILVTTILGIAALISDHSLTPVQQIAVYQQSGVYP